MQKAHDELYNDYWKNKPDFSTPIIAEQLNRNEHSVDEIDNRVIILDTTKANQTDMLQAVKTIAYTKSTGTFRITFFNNTYVDINTDLEKLAVNFDYDDNPQSAHYQNLVITLDDGTVKYVDLSALITQYEFLSTSTIQAVVGADGSISFNVINGSITEDKLEPNFLANCRIEVAKAEDYADSAESSADSAEESAQDSEAWAVGKRNGTDVPSSDETYHNNAKYYADQARAIVGDKVDSFNGRTGTVTPADGDYSAEQITYDNTSSGLSATNVQSAIDEIANIDTFTATGTSFALTPTSEGNVLAHSIYGMSVQDGTPTPSSPVDIVSAKADFRCVGKNLIPYPYYDTTRTVSGITATANADGSISVSGTASQAIPTLAIFYMDNSISDEMWLDEGTYILSAPTDAYAEYGMYFFFRVYHSDGTNTLYDAKSSDLEVTVVSDDVSIRCGVSLTASSGKTIDTKVYPMLRLASVTDSTYEPYQAITANTDLTLRAIEVTSSDDYNLVRDGKYYIADSVDWSEDDGYVLTRRVGEVTLSSSEDIATSTGNDSPNSKCYRWKKAVFTNNTKTTGLTPIYSNRFVDGLDVNGLKALGKCLGRTPADSKDLQVYVSLDTTITTTTEAGNWLDANETKVQYLLDVPTTEPITSEQAQSLLSLKTYDTATSITCTADVAPTMEIEYAKERVPALALSGHNEALIAQELEGLYGAKNLISYPWYQTTKTENGVTFTDNGDGTVTVSTVSGGATANTALTIHARSSGEANDLVLPNGNYILSGCPSGGSNSTYSLRINITKNSSGIDIVREYGNGVSVTLDGDDFSQTETNVGVYIFVASGTIITTPITFKPMLRLATNTSNTYQPYAKTNQQLTDEVKKKTDKTDIATVESGTTASRAYSVGELVYVSGTLYRVKAAIASGATFTVGTNIEVTNVQEKIDNINLGLNSISGKLLIIGDSISDEQLYPNCWVKDFRERCEALNVEVVNHSLQGRTIGVYSGASNTLLNALNTVPEGDYSEILIFLGVNDWLNQVDIGYIGDTNTNSVCNNLIEFDTWKRTNYPNAKVTLITPLKAKYANDTRHKLLQFYIKAIASCGQYLGYMIIDAHSFAPILQVGRILDWTIDGIHPQNDYSPYLADFILNNMISESSSVGMDMIHTTLSIGDVGGQANRVFAEYDGNNIRYRVTGFTMSSVGLVKLADLPEECQSVQPLYGCGNYNVSSTSNLVMLLSTGSALYAYIPSSLDTGGTLTGDTNDGYVRFSVNVINGSY